MRLISWGTTARRDRWQKHPATSRVYLSLAEKVRNQVGVLPAPRLHRRAAVPSTTSTASSMGKGWFSFQKLSGSAAPGCRSGCTAEPGARRCPTGLWAPPRDAPAPQARSSPADAGSPLLFQPSNGNQHPVAIPQPHPAVGCERRWAERVRVPQRHWVLFPRHHQPPSWGPESPDALGVAAW